LHKEAGLLQAKVKEADKAEGAAAAVVSEVQV
jgi:hypothetical protein